MSKQKLLIVDRTMFVAACVLLGFEELKEKGLVEGGFDVDRAGIEAIVRCGRAQGFDEPCTTETEAATEAILTEW